MNQTHRIALGVLVLVSPVALSGCFKRTIQTGAGTVEVDQNSDSVTVNTNDGTATFKSSASLPAGFPSEVPTPNFGTITASYSGSDATNAGYTVTYTLTAQDATSASTRYQEQLKAAGYAIEGTASTDAGGTKLDVFSAKKGGNQVGVTVSYSTDGTATMNLAVTQRDQE